MPEDIQKALLRAPDDPTGTQLNLRLAPASLEERAVLVRELEADLQSRIDALDLPADSVLLVDLPEGQDPVRATPAGLATVGIGLLENLSANRANLTYLALSLAALFLVLRCRSLTRGLLALVPVLLAVGVSSLIVGLLEVRLSPLTTVSGPLVIATCAEFSVLILGRYLEERQRGLDPEVAAEHAARRTGRAFFTSAVATICGFAVLIGSALPLLRDFGILVTLNVAIAVLAALVVIPPLSIWADQRRWLGTQQPSAGPLDSVRLAAPFPGPQTVGAVIGAVGFAATGAVVYATADTTTGEASTVEYIATPLPTTTTTTPPTTVPPTTVPGQTGPRDRPEHVRDRAADLGRRWRVVRRADRAGRPAESGELCNRVGSRRHRQRRRRSRHRRRRCCSSAGGAGSTRLRNRPGGDRRHPDLDPRRLRPHGRDLGRASRWCRRRDA